MMKKQRVLPQLDAEIVREAKRWVVENKGTTQCRAGYHSPRISSELPDCSMPLTFDQYNYCSLGCLYCCVAGTKIATDQGSRAIESVEVGDCVYSKDLETGQVVKDRVVSVMERTVDVVLEIVREDGSVLCITEEHPVYVRGVGWKLAKDLQEGDDLVVSKRPDLSYRMHTKNPMKDLAIRKVALRKIVESWNRNGRFPQGERRVFLALRELSLNFIHQCVAPGPRRNYVLDFLLPDKKVCIEYDGHSRHYTDAGVEADRERDLWLLKTQGIRTFRIHRDQAFIPLPDLMCVLQEVVQ